MIADFVASASGVERSAYFLVDRIEEPGRFLAQPELGPDLADRRRLELAFAPPGPLAQPGEEPDRDRHAA